jgi:hypothetical protein
MTLLLKRKVCGKVSRIENEKALIPMLIEEICEDFKKILEAMGT